MPYKCIGLDLYHKKGGKWSIKQHCKSPENCQAAKGLLYALEEGSIKRPRKKRK
jgi:hypothetical protein